MERIEIIKTTENIDNKISIQGWIDRVRDHGKISFVEIRDRTGSIQCIAPSDLAAVPTESVVEVVGVVKKRPDEMVNKNLSTGTVEMEVESFRVLNLSKDLPIPINTSGQDINEEMRLKYRYIDLRRPRMRKIMKLRSDYIFALRQALKKREFTEVETPMLTKSTKEGSRDFIVPSRHHPGKFYALPQSPQQYKQLLMVAGVEKYFQFARCIRDEDLRADRGYEHTQLDLEMSFMSREQVMETIESMVKEAVIAVGGVLRDQKFPVIDYKDAMEKYGADKFDMRTEEEKKNNVLAFAWVINFPFFKQVNKEDAAEVKDSRSGWVFTHNPFSAPIPEHLEWHLKGLNIEQILTTQYDLVCNGYEVGGGSIRAHDPEILRATYRIMGYSEEDTQESVGHMIEAFSYGAPPHGGLALGIDRHIMLLAGEKSLKEVIAFPMTSTGKTSVMDAPAYLDKEDLSTLGIAIKDKGNEVVEKIRNLLDQSSKQYQYMEHEEVRTSEEAAKVRGIEVKDGAKAMVLKSKVYDNKYIMVVIPADKMIDLDKVRSVLDEEFEIANGKEVEEFTGIKMGAVPPFGRIFGIELYFDKEMWTKEKSAFNCGKRSVSIIAKTSDLIELAQPHKISKESDFIK